MQRPFSGINPKSGYGEFALNATQAQRLKFGIKSHKKPILYIDRKEYAKTLICVRVSKKAFKRRITAFYLLPAQNIIKAFKIKIWGLYE